MHYLMMKKMPFVKVLVELESEHYQREERANRKCVLLLYPSLFKMIKKKKKSIRLNQI